VEENLALACPHFNRFKGPNIAGVHPEISEITRTPIGRVIVLLLARTQAISYQFAPSYWTKRFDRNYAG